LYQPREPSAVRLELVLEDPLTGDDIDPRRPGDQVPCVVGQQGLVLLHSATLVGVHERATNRGRDQVNVRGAAAESWR
jgi:hypothetical protein